MACGPIFPGLLACDGGAAWVPDPPPPRRQFLLRQRFLRPSLPRRSMRPPRLLPSLPSLRDLRAIVYGAGLVRPAGPRMWMLRSAPPTPRLGRGPARVPLLRREPSPPPRPRSPRLPLCRLRCFRAWAGRRAADPTSASVSAWAGARRKNHSGPLRRRLAPRADQPRRPLPPSCARSTHVLSFLRTARRQELRPLGRPEWKGPGNCTSRGWDDPSAHSPMAHPPNTTRVNTHGNTSSWPRSLCSRRSGPDPSVGSRRAPA